MSTPGPKTGVSVHTTQPFLFVLVLGAMSRFLGKPLFITFCCFCKTVSKSSHSGSFVLMVPQKHISWPLKNTFIRQQESARRDSERILSYVIFFQKRTLNFSLISTVRAWGRALVSVRVKRRCVCVCVRACVCVCACVCRQSWMEFGMSDIRTLLLAANDLNLSLMEVTIEVDRKICFEQT